MLNWKEGPAPYNVMIRNAKITECVIGIQCCYLSTQGKALDTRPIRKIVIDNAAISKISAAALRICNVDGALFNGIVFKDVSRAATIDNSGNLNFTNCKIDATDLTMSDLRLERTTEDSIEGAY